MKRGTVHVIVGGSYGSESKGLAVAQCCFLPSVSAVVRTGSINAGHTVYFKGKAYAMQQIPVGWINPSIMLVIGRGAYVHKETLMKEIATVEEATGRSIKDKLFIDPMCFVHTDEHIEEEREQGIHTRIGSTSEGVGAALIDKVSRKKHSALLIHQDWSSCGKFQLVDTQELLDQELQMGNDVVVEGTQGTMLDVHFGEYPYVTSRQTIASAWLAEAGLPPVNVSTTMVCRAFPIRVAGNSGSLPGELGWLDMFNNWNAALEGQGLPPRVPAELIKRFTEAELQACKDLELSIPPYLLSQVAKEQNKKSCSEFYSYIFSKDPQLQTDLKPFIEMTTVTKKVRRIAALDEAELAYAARLNRPAWVVMNFLNYKFPSLQGKTNDELTGDERLWLKGYKDKIEGITGSALLFGSTSPTTLINFDTI